MALIRKALRGAPFFLLGSIIMMFGMAIRHIQQGLNAAQTYTIL